jgi:CcmD family protein
MFFLQAPPDTSRFLIAGYTIAIVVMLLYVLSLYLRQRRLERDLQDLEELIEQEPEAVLTT